MGTGQGFASGRPPIALSSFIGRGGEARAAAELCTRHRIVTLTGSGGCGKTRLALHTVTGPEVGDCRWVELAPLAPGAVAEHTARAIGAGVPPGVDPVDAVATALETAETVLVLDNAEHVLDEVATLLVTIAGRCPGVRFLVTSREPLGVPGEIVWRVPSLAVPPPHTSVVDLERFDAAKLFLERAREHRSALVIDERAAAAVASICERLDGIPLAIELAAARARSLALDRLAAGLDDAFRLLTGGARTALARHQTLRSSIQWSVDLLDDLDRTVLRRLAVLQAPFTVEAADAIASDGLAVAADAVLDSLGRLVDKGLVQFDDRSGRYRMLETVRQFGAEARRDAGDDVATLARHATWWARFCTAAGRGEHGFAAADLMWAMPDITAASDWSRHHDRTALHRIVRGLGWLHAGLAHWGHLERCYDAVVATDAAERDADWAAAIAGLSWPAILLQRTEIFDLLDAADSLLDDDDARRLLRYAPALIAAFGGQPEPMRSLAADVIAADDRLACPHVVGAMLSVAQALGYFDEARHMWRTLATTLARHGLAYSSDNAMVGHYGAVYLLLDEGRLAEARALADATHEPTDTTMAVASAASLAALASALGDRELMATAGRWVARDLPPGSETVACFVRALVASAAGHHDHAAALVLRVLDGDVLTAPMFYLQYRRFVRVLLRVDLVQEAADRVEAALAHTATLGDPPLPVASLRLARAMTGLAQQRDREAFEDVHRCLTLCEDHGYALLLLDALEVLAALHTRRQQPRIAARLLGAAASGRSRIGSVEHFCLDDDDHTRLLADLREREPAAFEDGASTPIDEIVAYAQRSRGERARPALGWESLTPTERQVASLVASGQSNAAIAKALLMSPATVKTHLTHTFAKLGITNRTELAALVLRSGATS